MTTKIAHLFEKSVWPWGQIKAFSSNAYEKVIIGILMRQDHGRIRCIIKTVTFVYTTDMLMNFACFSKICMAISI